MKEAKATGKSLMFLLILFINEPLELKEKNGEQKHKCGLVPAFQAPSQTKTTSSK